jgi:N-methylhydantoinase B
MSTGGTWDPIKFEVIRNALVQATEEMAIALRRSAFSTNIKTRNDYSCAFFNDKLQTVAQALGQPNHLSAFEHLVPDAIRRHGAERLGPGDTLVTNEPYPGGAHLNDITVVSPVYCDGEVLGYVANLAHHVDVGGGAPASVGAFREVFQEGVIIPPVKLAENGQIVKDVFDLILAQIRSKRETAGDFRAQLAANNSGIRALTALVGRYGIDTVRSYMDEVIAYAERRTRAAVAALPQGVFTSDGTVDTDGFSDAPVHLVAAVTIDKDGIQFDFTGSDPQRRAPVNSTYGQTFSACAYVLKSLVGPDVPVNAGFYRFVRVVAPVGTVTNCTPPAPVVGGWETSARLTDIIYKALAPVLPKRVPAGTKAMICHVGFGGLDPQSGEYYCFLETIGGGYGGRYHSDGPDAVQTHGQNTENAPIEETELNYPVRIIRYALVNDSEGPGRFRGGLGLRRDYLFPDHEVTFTILADRDREGPWGLFGGHAGRRAEYILNPDGEARRLNSKTTLELRQGDVVSYRTCGGGGYGPPEERDSERVLQDVRDCKVSVTRAREIYRVAIDTATWTVDTGETARLRRDVADSRQPHRSAAK